MDSPWKYQNLKTQTKKGRDENISPNGRRQRRRLMSEVDRRPWPELFYWSTSTSKKAQWSTKSDWAFLLVDIDSRKAQWSTTKKISQTEIFYW